MIAARRDCVPSFSASSQAAKRTRDDLRMPFAAAGEYMIASRQVDQNSEALRNMTHEICSKTATRPRRIARRREFGHTATRHEHYVTLCA